MNKNFTLTLLIAAAFIGFSMNANAQSDASATGDSTAELIAGLTITKQNTLDFGRIMTTNTAGTVTVSNDGLSDGVTGGVAHTSDSSPAPATFILTGEPNASYTVTLPANDVVFLTHSVDAISTLAVNGFETASLTPSLDANGDGSISVGAVLSVGTTADSPSGVYNGTFDVSVYYN
ncbi:DUF4402 domain-containing protein [Salinimicrobium catena]|uniref:DUF4402 domain-containing protein n=1 Tax=Salinimicrobium catena TaxID=390640 RepID=UPI002FE4D0D0